MKKEVIYDHRKIEKKWKTRMNRANLFVAKDDDERPKQYILDMYPYPSGAGLHVGHPKGYVASDVVARHARMKGANVLHPFGWDSFGLPTENFAIKQGVHPRKVTKQNIKRFRKQVDMYVPGIDWSREITTSEPDYYRWTQWLFLEMYRHGLAYKKEAPVNWCPSCNTVLANEQVIAGKCERCDSEVEQRQLAQWFWKATDYAEQLLSDLEKLDWPEKILHAQKNWIGKSTGAELTFAVKDSKEQLEVFTTRPDTLMGTTYMVISPDHPVLHRIVDEGQRIPVEQYVKKAHKKSTAERDDVNREKTGVFTGAFAVHPITKENVPIWVADYVVMNYGTGVIMAVPAHDERDFVFAKKYDLPIVEVVSEDGEEHELKEAYIGEGFLINSGDFNATRSEKARQILTDAAKGKNRVQYKLRDWLISRQRYWGAPIPMIHCEDCGMVPVPEKDLPVELPDDVDFRPTGEAPLESSKSFHKVKCPTCDKSARRESDTMDTFVCSAWYFLRYCDPHNTKQPFDEEKVAQWMPVNVYVGGAEHAVLHLMYARFVVKALRDFGYLKFDEPFLKLRSPGHILGEDNRKMSKSRGNVVNPDDVIEQYGADTFRMYVMFLGPFSEGAPWSTEGINGVRRFLERVHALAEEADFHESASPEKSVCCTKRSPKLTATLKRSVLIRPLVSS